MEFLLIFGSLIAAAFGRNKKKATQLTETLVDETSTVIDNNSATEETYEETYTSHLNVSSWKDDFNFNKENVNDPFYDYSDDDSLRSIGVNPATGDVVPSLTYSKGLRIRIVPNSFNFNRSSVNVYKSTDVYGFGFSIEVFNPFDVPVFVRELIPTSIIFCEYPLQLLCISPTTELTKAALTVSPVLPSNYKYAKVWENLYKLNSIPEQWNSNFMYLDKYKTYIVNNNADGFTVPAQSSKVIYCQWGNPPKENMFYSSGFISATPLVVAAGNANFKVEFKISTSTEQSQYLKKIQLIYGKTPDLISLGSSYTDDWKNSFGDERMYLQHKIPNS